MRTFVVATILVAVAIGYATRGHRSGHSAPAVTAAASIANQAPDDTAAATAGSVEIRRGPGGHFTVNGSVGGIPLDFVVDTGASQVALGRADARRVGLWVSDGDFDGVAQTATASIRVAHRILPRLRVGGIELTEVAVVVLDVPQAMPLLGQSFLRRIGRVSIEGDRMTLAQR